MDLTIDEHDYSGEVRVDLRSHAGQSRPEQLRTAHRSRLFVHAEDGDPFGRWHFLLAADADIESVAGQERAIQRIGSGEQ